MELGDGPFEGSCGLVVGFDEGAIWVLSSPSELRAASRSALPARIENQISTWLSQNARVGVKWKCTFGWRFSQRPSFGLCVFRLSRMT